MTPRPVKNVSRTTGHVSEERSFPGATLARAVTDALLALLPKARRRWAQTDPVLARLSREHAPTARPIADPSDGFDALVGSLVHQQVSLAAGRAIYSRLTAALGGAVTPEAVLRVGPDGMRAAGLSRPKATYVADLAAWTAAGAIAFDRFPSMPDDDVVTALTAVKGIGDWTAKMFLIFHLSRPDVLAPEDLGLRIAVSHFYRVSPERAAALMEKKRPAWSPYASVASLVLWNARRAVGAAGRKRAPAPSRPRRG